MASALSSAFQGSTVADENSYKPSRAAPPVPSVAYTNTIASRAPEQGDRPYQAHTEQHRARQASPQYQQAQGVSQYHPGYEPPYSSISHQQQQSFQSRPSTQASFSQPQAPPTRGRQEPSKSTPSLPADAPQPPPVPPSSLTNPPRQKKRSGSFSFLRRSSSNQPSNRDPYPPQPAVPVTAAAQIIKSSNHHPHPSDGSITSNSTGVLRARSRDGKGDRNMLRKTSKLKQQQQAEYERQQRLHEAATRQPPRLPQHAPLPGIDSFGGETQAYPESSSQPPASTVPANAANFSRPGGMSSSYNNSSSSPAYAVQSQEPALTNGGDYYEPTGERSTSMTNRGRYSYASSTAQTGNVNSPRRVRRRKDPTPFNVLVIGTKNSGKSSFISFLRNSLAHRSDRQDTNAAAPVDPTAPRSTFTSQYLETEIDGERVGVTLWDSAGLEEHIVDLQLPEMTAFLESKFEETFSEEQKVVRSPGFKDTHIHCVFLVLDPIRLDSNVLATSAAGRGTGGLDEGLDLQVLRALWGKTTVIPVISKADTLTVNHMTFLKRAVWQSVKSAKLNPLDALELDDDDDDELEEDDEDEGYEGYEKPKRPGHARQSSLSSTISDEDPYIPMSILSPDPYSMPPYTKYAPKSQSEIGRRYAWGFASPFDPQHCDFIRLKDTIFSEWRGDLRELSRVKWYEQWRTSRLRHAPQTKSRTQVNSANHSLPIRDSAADRQVRNFSSGPQGAPRAQTVSGAQPAAVGMAVTTDNSRY